VLERLDEHSTSEIALKAINRFYAWVCLDGAGYIVIYLTPLIILYLAHHQSSGRTGASLMGIWCMIFANTDRLL
jgi:hypothetical protein